MKRLVNFRRSEHLRVNFQMWYEMVRVELWITLMTAKVVKQKAFANDHVTRAQLQSYIMKYERCNE